jgi:hypothetical protein
LGIQIPDPDPRPRKLRNFSGKMHFLASLKIFTTKNTVYKIALTTGTFWGEKLMKNTGTCIFFI